MRSKLTFEQILLWVFVILCGIEVGAGIYEIRVVQPLILHALPQSVWKFSDLRTQYPEFAINPGFRFWKYTSPPILLLAISFLIRGFVTEPRRKAGFLTIAVIVLICFASTLLYFAPTTGVIMDSRKMGLSAEETIRVVTLWTNLNWIRLLIYSVAWLLALRLLVSTSPQAVTITK